MKFMSFRSDTAGHFVLTPTAGLLDHSRCPSHRFHLMSSGNGIRWVARPRILCMVCSKLSTPPLPVCPAPPNHSPSILNAKGQAGGSGTRGRVPQMRSQPTGQGPGCRPSLPRGHRLTGPALWCLLNAVSLQQLCAVRQPTERQLHKRAREFPPNATERQMTTLLLSTCAGHQR